MPDESPLLRDAPYLTVTVNHQVVRRVPLKGELTVGRSSIFETSVHVSSLEPASTERRGFRRSLYGALPFDEPNLAILMRHRAVLFGLLGLFLVFTAFRPALQTLAFIAGFVSVISYLWLALSVGSYNAFLARVVIADVVALICLAAGAAAHAYQQFQD